MSMSIRLYLDGIAAAPVSLSFASRSARAWSEMAPSPPPGVFPLLLLVDMSVCECANECECGSGEKES